MFIPLKDQNPLQIIPFQIATLVFIVTNVAIFLYQSSLPEQNAFVFMVGYGMVPAALFDTLPVQQVTPTPAELTLITSMFLHSGWFHLLGNMLFLWVFGDNIEDCMGHFRFVLFFLLCGVAAGATHAVAFPASKSPMIGASGAVAGVMGAYIMMYPKVKVLVLLFKRIPIYLPAYMVIASWIILQIYSIYNGAAGNTAWWAHIGGFVAGALLIIIMKKKGTRLFGGKRDRASNASL